MPQLKRLIRNYWPLALLVGALVCVIGTAWVLFWERDVSEAVALAALAVLLVGVSLLLARTRQVQRQLATLLKDQGMTSPAEDFGWSDAAATSTTQDMLRRAEPDEAATLLHTLAELRQDEDLRHAEVRLLTEDLRAAQSEIGRRLARIEDAFGAAPTSAPPHERA